MDRGDDGIGAVRLIQIGYAVGRTMTTRVISGDRDEADENVVFFSSVRGSNDHIARVSL